MVMMSYSDSMKDAGMLAASWAQYTAQEDLINLCSGYGTKLRLFHGRGQFGKRRCSAQWLYYRNLLALYRRDCGLRNRESNSCKVRIKFYSNKNLCVIYKNAIIQANLLEPPKPKPEWRQMMGELSKIFVQNTGRSLGIILSLSHILGMQLLKEN